MESSSNPRGLVLMEDSVVGWRVDYTNPFKRLILRAVLRKVSPMVIGVLAVPDYQDLAGFYEVFRTLKTGLLEVRPVWVRKARRTRGTHLLLHAGAESQSQDGA